MTVAQVAPCPDRLLTAAAVVVAMLTTEAAAVALVQPEAQVTADKAVRHLPEAPAEQAQRLLVRQELQEHVLAPLTLEARVS